jgi:hypothetical protein
VPQGAHSPFRGLAGLPDSPLGPSGGKGISVGTAPASSKSGAPTVGVSVGVKPAWAERQSPALSAPEEI